MRCGCETCEGRGDVGHPDDPCGRCADCSGTGIAHGLIVADEAAPPITLETLRETLEELAIRPYVPPKPPVLVVRSSDLDRLERYGGLPSRSSAFGYDIHEIPDDGPWLPIPKLDPFAPLFDEHVVVMPGYGSGKTEGQVGAFIDSMAFDEFDPSVGWQTWNPRAADERKKKRKKEAQKKNKNKIRKANRKRRRKK